MRNGSELLKIGDFARLAGTNLRTLRYYEELGLITPAARSQGGFRYFRPTDVNRVQLIRDLQELGLHLDRIGELVGTRLEVEDRSSLFCRVRQALIEHERLLIERVQMLDAQRGQVRAALDKAIVANRGRMPEPRDLLEAGVYCIGFSFPVVPRGQARIRLQASAAHTDAHLDRCLEAFAEVGRKHGAV